MCLVSVLADEKDIKRHVVKLNGVYYHIASYLDGGTYETIIFCCDRYGDSLDWTILHGESHSNRAVMIERHKYIVENLGVVLASC